MIASDPTKLPRLVLVTLLGLRLPAPAQTDHRAQWIAFNRAGGPNSQLQCFTPKNVSVSNGNLVITTNAEAATCSSFDLSAAAHGYASGFVAMRSFNFLYGTVEVRAKFGGGTGTGAWPAIWMADASCQASDPTGTDGRCNGQEIDVAEILNSDFTHVNQQIHVDNFAHNDGCTALATDSSKTFHVYQLLWSPGSLVFRIDGATTCTVAKPYAPSAPMYLKLDMFAGKAGGPVRNSSLPWTTLIDYVKVTQGSTVLFNDDFNLASAVQPGPAARNIASSTVHLTGLKVQKTRLRWSQGALLLALAIVAGITATKLLRPKHAIERTNTGVAEK